jgi:NifU-like protein involved in Fe-S cluster formation
MGHLPFAVQSSCMYSAHLLDHFQHPRNPGDVPDPDATAQIENPVCGDVLRLTLKISVSRIADARFKAQGCVPTIACGSALTELLVGKTIEEARKLRREDLVLLLGEMPEGSTHAAQLAIDALSAALGKIRN